MRRRSTTAALATFAVVLGFAVAVPSSGATSVAASLDNATHFQIDPAHDGHAAGDNISAALEPLWSVPAKPATTPLIVDGRVFVLDVSGELTAYDAATGSVLWGPRWVSNTGLTTGMTYGDGRLVTLGSEGNVEAWDPASGASVWATQLGGPFTDSAPTISGGLVYVVEDEAPLVALRVSDGTRVFAGATPGTSDNIPPAVGDGRLYMSGGCDAANADDALTGRQQWFHKGVCTGGGDAPSAFWQHRVYVPAYPRDPSLILDAATGADLGTYSNQEAPAFDDDMGFFVDANRNLIAQDLTTGATLWTAADSIAQAPLTANHMVFAVSTTGIVRAYAEDTGTVVWQSDVADATSSLEWNGQITGMAIGNALLAVASRNKVTIFGDPSMTRVPAVAPPALPPIHPGHVSAPATGTEWTQHSLDAEHDNAQLGETVTAPFSKLWDIDFGDGSPSEALITPTAVYSVVVLGQPGSPRPSELVGLDRLTGQDLWPPVPLTGPDGTPGHGAAAIDGTTIYVSTSIARYAIDAVTGSVLWRVTTDSYSIPMIVNHRLYIDGAEINTQDGSRISGIGYSVTGGLTSDGIRIFATNATLDAEAYPLDLAFQGASWTAIVYAAGGGGGQPASVHANELFARSNYQGNGTFSVGDGAYRDYLPTRTLPAFDGRVAFIESSNRLQAVDICSHRDYWQTDGSTEQALAPVVANGLVFETTVDGRIQALDERDGGVVWEADTGDTIPERQNEWGNAPGLSIAQGMLIVPTANHLIAYAGSPGSATDAAGPDAPTITTATQEDGTLDLTWADGASDGGDQVTGYDVTVQPDGVDVPLDPCTQSVDLPINSVIARHVELGARNAVGSSPAASIDLSAPAPPSDAGGGGSTGSGGSAGGGGGTAGDGGGSSVPPPSSPPTAPASGRPQRESATLTLAAPAEAIYGQRVTLAGRLLQGDSPIADARVLIGPAGGGRYTWTTTSSDGSFTRRVRARTKDSYVAWYPGSDTIASATATTGSMRVHWRATARRRRVSDRWRVAISIRPAGHQLRVRVRLPDGETRVARTNAHGNLLLVLRHSPRDVTVPAADGYAPTIIPIRGS